MYHRRTVLQRILYQLMGHCCKLDKKSEPKIGPGGRPAVWKTIMYHWRTVLQWVLYQLMGRYCKLDKNVNLKWVLVVNLLLLVTTLMPGYSTQLLKTCFSRNI